MNRTKLKNYAPQARRDFIQAVTDRAAYLGLTAMKVEAVKEQGDSVLIGGKAVPRKVGEQRKRLEERVRQHGFKQTMEALAYTWFNRLVAIRFMELHDHLENGEGGASYRVLSNPDKYKPTPEILEKAEHVTLESLDRQKVIDLKLDGTKEVELYRLLLIAECNALNSAMPFLFERIDDETELVLPDNLLHSDSLIRRLVNEIDEEDWQQVEIIGWLYQFYISEKKDEVIGKVVASEDIPAATQLFTPNWIVKYLVQNTLGRQWLATYPQSALRQQMAYYIEPAEQSPEVQEQLKAITPTSLNPEEITLLDPACGSGHILVETYDLFKAIYQERGYRAKDIPRLILQKNLFGLEIDERAAQLAAFALMMKARADDRRIFSSEAKPNMLAIQESNGLNARDITAALYAPILKEKPPLSQYLFEEIEDEENPLFSRKVLSENDHVSQADVSTLLELFKDAKTFGSLIQVPPKVAEKLPSIEQRLRDVLRHGDLTHASAGVIKPLLQQARLLARQYEVVVANPPYMGSKYQTVGMKSFVSDNYPACKPDIFSAFIRRSLSFGSTHSTYAFVVPYVWMFIHSYAKFRDCLLDAAAITSLIQLEYNAFEPACVPVCCIALSKPFIFSWRGDYIRLSDFKGHQNQAPRTLDAIQDRKCGWFYTANQSDFSLIPGRPIAYWIGERLRKCFQEGTALGKIADVRQGMKTADNNRFLRRWYEVSHTCIGFGYPNREAAHQSRLKWFPYNKGGEFRRWYGNNEWVVNWESDGHEIQNFADDSGYIRSRPQSLEYMFRPAITWTDISSSFFAVRCSDIGFLFDASGSSVFSTDQWRLSLLGLLACKVTSSILAILNPTMHFEVGNVAALPVFKSHVLNRISAINPIVREAVELARADWDSFETSWSFKTLPLLRSQGAEVPHFTPRTLVLSQTAVDAQYSARFNRMRELEEQNNQLFIETYGLQGELSPDVSDDQITLYHPDRLEDVRRLLSYAIGCMMGRYSLDKPGLIYAHSGNMGFDSNQYKTFPADDDGIIPLLGADWGIRDDAADRIVEFISLAWPKEHLEENLKFIAESLGATKNEHSRDTIRRYLATGFFKDHLRWYKRRPIYWLFSSGRQRAFQCLVYLHRHHEGTLARMRTEYIIPLQSKIAARIEQLEGDKNKAGSTSHRKKVQKEQDDLKKQQIEIFAFDEKLKHAADQKIVLDLDDGVKVNYGKFGDLLAEVKAVTGGSDE